MTFFLPIAATDKVTAAIAAIERSAALVNSGTFGVGEADVVEVPEGAEVGVADADVLAESDMTASTLL